MFKIGHETGLKSVTKCYKSFRWKVVGFAHKYIGYIELFACSTCRVLVQGFEKERRRSINFGRKPIGF